MSCAHAVRVGSYTSAPRRRDVHGSISRRVRIGSARAIARAVTPARRRVVRASMSRALRVVVAHARGRAFDRADVTVRATLETRDDPDASSNHARADDSARARVRVDDASARDAMSWTSVLRGGDDARAVRVSVVDGSGDEIARGRCRLDGTRARGDAVVPGRWCVVRAWTEGGGRVMSRGRCACG